MDNKIDEKWYQIDGTENKRLRKIAVVILIVVAVLWGYSAWKSARHVPALPGEVILKATMAFEEADSKVQEAGNIPKDEVYTKGVDTYRNYEGGEAFGYKTWGSMLGHVKSSGNYFFYDLYILEESKQYNQDNPGEVFHTIQEELTNQTGKVSKEVESLSGRKTWSWNLEGKTEVGLFYTQDGVVTVRYVYKSR